MNGLFILRDCKEIQVIFGSGGRGSLFVSKSFVQ